MVALLYFMDKKIITHINEDVKNFYQDNISFKVLQVQKSSGVYGKVKKEYIAQHPTKFRGIQINSNDYTNALCFDCDHEDVMLYRDYNLPTPTITTINQTNGRHHHIYYLDDPIPRFAIKTKTINYVKDIYDSLSCRLEADINYTNVITKNFLNTEEFRTISCLKKYKLEDLKKCIIDTKSLQVTDFKETSYSRHLSLFNELRYFGYRIASKCETEDELYISIFNYAQRLNRSFEEQINVKHIVKNVHQFCWINKDNFSENSWNWDGYVKQPKEVTSRNHKTRWCKYRETKATKLKKDILERLKIQ